MDSTAIVDYISKNLRNICLTSSYVLLLTISTMKTPLDNLVQQHSSSLTDDVGSSFPRASLPNMTAELEPEVESGKRDEKKDGYYTYEFTHNLPVKCSGVIL